MCDRGYEPVQILVRGVSIHLCVYSRHLPSPDRIPIIGRTLGLLPVPHLEVIARGHIRLSQPGDTPKNGGGNGGSETEPWIRISAVSLAAAQTFSPTLLHEMGHVVDRHYHAMETLRKTHPSLWRTLRNTPHDGHTQFDGERFADAYMIYFLTQVAGVHHVSRAAHGLYEGEERDKRFSALLSSPAFAFRYWAAPLTHLRVPPEVPQAGRQTVR